MFKKKQKRGTDGYGKWDKYDDFEVDLSFSWFGLCVFTLILGLFVVLPRVPVVGIIWVVSETIYLFKKIRETIKNKIRDYKEVVEEEKPPYHIQLAMEQERKEAEERAKLEAELREKKLAELEKQKESSLISEKEYRTRRKELIGK